MALISKWDEVNEEEGCYYITGHRVGMLSVNQSLELPSSGCPRNGCILFLLLKLKKKREKKSLYDLEKLSIARTNK